MSDILKRLEHFIAEAFDPESADYDYATAERAGMRRDRRGHMGSVAPVPGEPDVYQLLKGRQHPTWDKGVAAENMRGSAVVKRDDGRYYSEPFAPGGGYADGGLTKRLFRMFHVSPRKFERFDDSKIGRGLGASYDTPEAGWGHYLGPQHNAEEWANYLREKGHNKIFLYDVEIDAPRSSLAEWQRPLSEQRSVLQRLNQRISDRDTKAGLREMAQDEYMTLYGELTQPTYFSRNLQKALGSQKPATSEKEVSALLDQLGIPGHFTPRRDREADAVIYSGDRLNIRDTTRFADGGSVEDEDPVPSWTPEQITAMTESPSMRSPSFSIEQIRSLTEPPSARVPSWTPEQIRSMTHSTPQQHGVRTIPDYLRSMRDIAAEHYIDQATGLATNPLGTMSRNVRTASELTLPVTSAYKLVDMATGAPEATVPDAWDVAGDVGALAGYGAGRQALRALGSVARRAAPAAAASVPFVAFPQDAEAGGKSDIFRLAREAVDARLPSGTFSPAARAIESAPQDMTGAQWRNYLRNRNVDVSGQRFPVRPDELEFTGLDELLRQHEGAKVGRGDLLDFLGRAPNSNARPLTPSEYDDLLYLQANRNNLEQSGLDRLASLERRENLNNRPLSADEYENLLLLRADGNDLPQAGRDRLASLERRERLNPISPAQRELQQLEEKLSNISREETTALVAGDFQTSERLSAESRQINETIRALREQLRASNSSSTSRNATYPREDVLGTAERRPTAGGTQYEQHQLPGPRENYEESLTRVPGLDYNAPHFNNMGRDLVSHSRMSTRPVIEPDGSQARGVHIDEIQSDLHQKARDEGGYRKPSGPDGLPEGYSLRSPSHANAMYEIVDPHGNVVEFSSTRQGALDAFKRLHPAADLPPPAPYQDRYHEVEFNKALRRAVDEDADYVTWTTGEQQAQRWNQQIQGNIRKLELGKDKEAGLWVTDASGNERLIRIDGDKYVAPDGKRVTLSELLGNSMAKKLEKEGVLEGENLSIGGGGFRNFYDGTINKFAESWARRFPGAEVGQRSLQGERTGLSVFREGFEDFLDETAEGRIQPDLTPAILEPLFSAAQSGQRLSGAPRTTVFNRLRDGFATFHYEKRFDRLTPKQQREILAETNDELDWLEENAAEYLRRNPIRSTQTAGPTVHSLRLTPEMKAWIKANGTPIMSVAGAGAAVGANSETLQRIEELLGERQ